MNASTRFMLTITPDMVQRADVLKKSDYYDKPYAEMFRQLISIGMDTLEAQKRQKGGTKK